ncbi:MAG TPA: hypothetical protein VJ846_02540 [Sphingomicrobium sp.]|nr:hypothetical protein [Sphingomicrobium sp.]
MSRTLKIVASIALLLFSGCHRADHSGNAATPPASYYDNSAHPDAWTGGERKITISTPQGPHQFWIKRIGNNPWLKLLLLTGGPGLSHAHVDVMDSYLPADGKFPGSVSSGTRAYQKVFYERRSSLRA